MTLGPVQMLVVGFTGDKFTGEILEELRRLADEDVVRLVDLMAVRKDASGNVESLQQSDLSPEEAMEFGTIVGALMGFGADGEDGAVAGAEAGAEALEDGHVFADDEKWFLADAIPVGQAAAVALLEHRWAIPLRGAIERAGGTIVADEWVHPADLVAVGVEAARA